MSLRDQLDRFEVELLRVSPESVVELNAPANSGDLARLESAIAPFAVPEDVRTLYGWHNGTRLTAFAGREFLSIDGMLRERELLTRGLAEPPSWLPLFSDASGGRLFVEALPAYGKAEDSVWGKGKDYGPTLEYTSLTRMFSVLTSAFAGGLVSNVEFDNGYSAFNVTNNEAFPELKIELDPPARNHAVYRSFFPAMDWPASWLAAIGVDKASMIPTNGPSTPISDVIAAAANGPCTFTIAGQIGRSGSNADLIWMTVTDESGVALVMISPSERSPILENFDRVRIEVDVEAGPGIRRPDIISEKHFGGQPLKAIRLRLHEPDDPSS